MRRNGATALGGLRGDRRGVRVDAQGGLGRLPPTLVVIPLVVLLVRYRATVTRTVVVLVAHLGRAASSSRPPALAGAQHPSDAQQSPAALANLPTTGITGSAEVAERVAGSPSSPATSTTAVSVPTPSPTPAPVPGVDSAPMGATWQSAAEAGESDSVPGDGSLICPDDFPVKGNATSKIYHLPGTSYYTMTKASVCFRSPEAAERAGFRPSKASPIRSTSTTNSTPTQDGEGGA